MSLLWVNSFIRMSPFEFVANSIPNACIFPLRQALKSGVAVDDFVTLILCSLMGSSDEDWTSTLCFHDGEYARGSQELQRWGVALPTRSAVFDEMDVRQEVTNCFRGKLSRLFREIDVNGNGNVDWEEFSHHLIHGVFIPRENTEAEIGFPLETELELMVRLGGQELVKRLEQRPSGLDSQHSRSTSFSCEYKFKYPMPLLRLPKSRCYAPAPLQFLSGDGWNKFMFTETLISGAGRLHALRVNEPPAVPLGKVVRPHLTLHASTDFSVSVDAVALLPSVGHLAVTLSHGRLCYVSLSNDHLADEFGQPQEFKVERDQYYPGSHSILRYDVEWQVLVAVEAGGTIDVIDPLMRDVALPKVDISFAVGSPIHDVAILPERGVKAIVISTLDGRFMSMDLATGDVLVKFSDNLESIHCMSYSEETSLRDVQRQRS